MGYKVNITAEAISFDLLERTRSTFVNGSINRAYAIIGLFSASSRYGYQLVNERNKVCTNRFVILKNETIELYDGIKFLTESINPYVITETFFLGIHDSFEPKGKTVLDIGAGFGDTPLYYAKRGARVIAVEPVNFLWLEKNIALNTGLSGSITTLRIAAGRDGEIEMYVNENLSFDGNAMSNRKEGKKIKVQSKSIKKIIRDLGLTNIDFLKSDCKGCESEFDVDDFKLIKERVEIECVQDPRKIIDVLQKADFKVLMHHYDPTNKQPFTRGGTIVGEKLSNH
jgi:FkbM family methyltransferase